MRATPRTDPGVRNYRTGLLPRVVTHAHCGPAYPVQRVLQVELALSPKPALLSRISLGQAPSLQALRRGGFPPPLFASFLGTTGLSDFPSSCITVVLP